MAKLTIEQRRAKFKELFEKVPGSRRIDKIRQICSWTYSEEQTVRIWMVETDSSNRAIPQKKLQMLEDRIKARNHG